MVNVNSADEQKSYDFDRLKSDLIKQLSFLTEEYKSIIGNPPSCHLIQTGPIASYLETAQVR